MLPGPTTYPGANTLPGDSRYGQAASTLQLAAEASGHAPGIAESHGSAASSITFGALANGHAPVVPANHGEVSGTLEFLSTASGHSPASEAGHGFAASTLTLVGVAEGHAVRRGSASHSMAFHALATGYAGEPPMAGWATGYLVFTGSASGHSPGVGEHHGWADGTLEFTSAAYGFEGELPSFYDPYNKFSEYNGVGVQENTVYDKGADALTSSDKLRLMSITGQTTDPQAAPDPYFWYGNSPPPKHARRRPRPRYPHKKGTSD